MITNRSKLSLCQFLSLQNISDLNILLEKHGMGNLDILIPYMDIVRALQNALSSVSPEQLLSLLGEIIRTTGDLRTRVTPKYRYDERLDDLERCLLLDGYKINARILVSAEPSLNGVAPIEDDFSRELGSSGLAQAEKILGMIEKSAEDFRKSPPDYNGCLTNARVALETLASAIAMNRKAAYPEAFNEEKWGEVVAYLRKSELISKKEEEGLTGVYSFVSPGAHRPVGFSDQEMTRLGRSLIASMCYFLVKLHNNHQ